MSPENPYAPSQYPAERAEVEIPSSGVYRWRRYVVKHRDSPLPQRCIKTGVPTMRAEELKLECQGKNDGSIAWASRKLLGLLSTKYVVTVYVDEDWARKGWLHVLGGITMLFGAIGSLLGLPLAMASPMPSAGYVNGVLLAGGGMILVALGWWLVDWASWRFSLIQIRCGYMFLQGACREYLNSLPLWPE